MGAQALACAQQADDAPHRHVPAPQAVPKGIQESIAASKFTVPWCLHTRVPDVSVQTQRQSLRGNHILAAMPKTETVDMPLAQVVFEPGGELQHAYFPLSAIVSLLCGVNNGESAEIALVGNDGVLGVTVLMGGNATTVGAVVQSAGQGWRLPARELEAEVRRGDEMLMTRMARAGPATPCCTSVRRRLRPNCRPWWTTRAARRL